MDWAAVALANLRFSLEVASTKYARFVEYTDSRTGRELLLELSAERASDAKNLQRAGKLADLVGEETRHDEGTTAEMLGLGRHAPTSPASVAFRVQRSENTLGRAASHLSTLTEDHTLRGALDEVRQRVDERRRDVQRFRRMSAGGDAKRMASAPEEQQGREIAVWFGTNRAESDGRFLGERSARVHYGRCQVFVPDNRNVGSLGSHFLARALFGDDRIKLRATELLPVGTFWSEIAKELSLTEKSERHALVFLHGYRTTFEDAARRTAQLKADLNYLGPAAFFSWPSLGSMLGYAADRTAIEGSEVVIRKFLVDFATKSGATAVHIIAHSMGNQGLLRAMDSIANKASDASGIRFGQIILAAPDVDRDLFENLARVYVKLARRSTLYVSENDRAIEFSYQVNQFDRVGLAPPVTVIPGMDTVNVTKVNLNRLGHSYFAGVREVLGDIHQLLNNNTPPARRYTVRESGTPGKRHWILIR